MIDIKRRLITALFIWLMKWNGSDLIVCRRNDILLILMNKYGLSPEVVSQIIDRELSK